MIESPNTSAEESAVEADEIDFTPDPSQLARTPREGGVPRWLIAGLAVGGVTAGLLLLKPGPATVRAAESHPAPTEEIAKPAHQDLFQLPEWHDEPGDK